MSERGDSMSTEYVQVNVLKFYEKMCDGKLQKVLVVYDMYENKTVYIERERIDVFLKRKVLDTAKLKDKSK